MLPDPIKKFADLFARLPSIGPRQATRLAFHIKELGENSIEELANAISALGKVKTCPQCFFSFQMRSKIIPISSKTSESINNLCDFCFNPQRRKDIIAVVEKETDLISLEKTRKFNGRYLVLGELQKDGTLDAVQKLRLNNLKSYIQKELNSRAEEILLAISPTSYGDFNAGMIAQELKNYAKKITRLGRGIPTGGEIEFADEDTLGSALDHRS